MITKKITTLASKTLTEWHRDRATQLAAALSFYLLFSLIPILILLFALVSVFFSHDTSAPRILDQLTTLVGYDVVKVLEELIHNFKLNRTGGSVATVISLFSILLTSIATFSQLKDSLNQIWSTPKHKISGLKDNAIEFARNNILMFFLLLITSFLLILSLTFSFLLSYLNTLVDSTFVATPIFNVIQSFNAVLPFIISIFVIAVLYKILPDVVLSWRDVLIGASFTAIALTCVRYLFGTYLFIVNPMNVYATVGGVFLLLLWIYFSTLFFYLGAEFTKVYACTYGSRKDIDVLYEEYDANLQNRQMQRGFMILFMTNSLAFIAGILAFWKIKSKK